MHRFGGGLIAALFVVAASSGTAQGQMAAQFGVTGGVNIASISGNEISNKSNLTGFFVGGSVTGSMTDMISIYGEASYSQKGVKGREFDTDVELKAAYLDVPIMLRISPTTAGTTRPFFLLGGYAAFNVSCDIEAGGVSVDCDTAELDVKSVDFGVIGGAGIQVNQFGFFARYQLGLSDLAEDSDAKNRTIQIGASWTFMR